MLWAVFIGYLFIANAWWILSLFCNSPISWGPLLRRSAHVPDRPQVGSWCLEIDPVNLGHEGPYDPVYIATWQSLSVESSPAVYPGVQRIANPFGFAERSIAQSRTVNGMVYRWESTDYYIDGAFLFALCETFPLTCLVIWLWIRRPVNQWWLRITRPVNEWWLGKRPTRAQRRLAAGLCPTCAYDLRATPNRCPECGTVIHPPAAEDPTGPPARAS
jgi:hypothetical protein